MENRGLLAIIAVLLLGIFTVMVIQMNEQTPEEQVAGSVSQAISNVSNQMTENLRTQ